MQHVRKPVVQSYVLRVASGAVTGVKMGRLTIREAEKLVFNLDMLLLCTEHLKDQRLADIISYGMELEDTEELVNKRAVVEACEEIEQLISQFIQRHKKVA